MTSARLNKSRLDPHVDPDPRMPVRSPSIRARAETGPAASGHRSLSSCPDTRSGIRETLEQLFLSNT
jgi:hypothetical protein